MSDRIDSALCEELAARARDGSVPAWKDLVEHLWPHLFRFVRKHRSMGPFARSEDHVRNVAANVVGKLGDGERRGLRLFFAWKARSPGKGFDDWIRIATVNVIRDYVRQAMGDASTEEAVRIPSVKRLLNDYMTSPALERMGVRPPMTLAQTAREMLELARTQLPPDQLEALMMWLEGADFEEIAVRLGLLDTEDAKRLVRAAVAVLRRAFGKE